MRLGLSFEDGAASEGVNLRRADVALFVGFVRRAQRRGELPPSLLRWLESQGLARAPGARTESELAELLDVPVPIDDLASFEALFEPAGPTRSSPSEDRAPSYLAAAVRSFFAQGGRRCFVVRVGDPPALEAPREERLALAGALIPSAAGDLAAESPLDPTRWRGIAFLHALDEVSFLALPDLPWLVAQENAPSPPAPEPVVVPERFVECSEPPAPLGPAPAPSPVSAPRCRDEVGYRDWAIRLNLAASFLSRYRRDVQLVAAIPLPAEDTEASDDLFGQLLRSGLLGPLERPPGVASAFVQLGYPWWSWPGSSFLPEGLEPPDGALSGMLARNALLAGAFRSAAGRRIHHARAMYPPLSEPERFRARPLERPGQTPTRSFQERVSLLGPSVGGFELLSDVTTSGDESFRLASVNRLFSLWVRGARGLQDLVFEASGEALWAAVRSRLSTLGESLFRAGALRGGSAAQAFRVRCDASTMSRLDLDSGRVVAEVAFLPAVPVEGVIVSFALDEGQGVLVLSGGVAA